MRKNIQNKTEVHATFCMVVRKGCGHKYTYLEIVILLKIFQSF